MRRLLFVVLLSVFAAACGDTGTGTSPVAPGGESAAPGAVASGEPSAAASDEASGEPAAEEASGEPAAEEGDQGIVFGKPVVFGGSFPTAAVEVTNTSDLVKSFTAQATWTQGADIVGTAIGAVNDLRPGEKRVANLLIDGKTPKGATVDVGVDTMVAENESTDDADAAAQIDFGKPALSPGDFASIKVAVTNKDDAKHSFSVGAGIYRKGKLVGTGTGAVNDLAAGKKKTASLLVQGSLKKGDKVELWVDTLVE